MSLSIQGRLTAWYAGALLAALTLCGFVLYAAVVRLELSSVDEDLRRAASTIAFSMKAEEAEGLNLQAAGTDTVNELRIAGITLAIYETQGHLLAARWEGFDPAAVSAARLEGGLTTVRSGSGEWRTLVTRQSYKGGDYLVLNALPLDPVGRHTALIRTAFMAIIPITVALAAAGGWLLARSTLRPITRLAAEASQASHDQPAFRLTVPRRNDELTLLAKAFNSLLQRLQAAIESQRHFMADASHELRTPVSVIRSAADVTLSQPQRSTAEYQDSVSVIAEQAKRLSKLVDDLFLLARADVKGRPLATTRFYLDDVLAECVRAVELLGASRHVHVDVASDTDIEMEADEDLVRRMLMNLLENAVRHTAEDTRVQVAMTRNNDGVEIAIDDKGPGVPVEDRERIFERFVRLDPARAGGAGLGLPIARWIAEAHGGSLTLAGPSAPGCSFVVRLPLTPARDAV